jgi:DNA-damage-inducible protein D
LGAKYPGVNALSSEWRKTLMCSAMRFFQNAGYRGMYNMDLWRIREIKAVPSKRSPLDFMGKEELAANLFRVTQTEAKIKNDGIRGQPRLEATAEEVGQKVRKSMIEISGSTPQHLPPAEDIHIVKKDLKQAHKEFRKMANYRHLHNRVTMSP